jgi:hypothetical protein
MPATKLSSMVSTMLALSTLALPVAAGPTNEPFAATLAISETLSSDTGACSPSGGFAKGMIAGIGKAASLGVVTGMASDCIYATNPPNFAFNQGQLKLSTPSGDELYFSYQGAFNFSRPVRVLGCAPGGLLYQITGTYLIKGGTGRFVNATGTGTLTGYEAITVDPTCSPPYFGILELKGQISY